MALSKIKLFNSEEELLNVAPQGVIKTIKVGSSRYCLFTVGINTYMTELSCPHLGYPLNQGVITPFGEITCKWHNYRFNLKTGEETELRCRNLRIYKVESTSDGVYAMLPD